MENLDEDFIKDIIYEVLARTPYILYFDDFTDRVPEEIDFPSDYSENDSQENKDSKLQDIGATYGEWHTYIEEIFKRTHEGISLESFLSTDDSNDRNSMLSDVTSQIHHDIVENWQQLTGLLGDFREEISEEIKNLKLVLLHNTTSNKHVFEFKVIDERHGGRGRYFSVIERSKGFQWFFNFAVKLKYNPKYTEEFEGAIYLLDEPGSYLHSSALSNLLKSLHDISKLNQVIYCTHSQYLLDPDVVNIYNIRICVRQGSKIELQNYGEYRGSDHSMGALSPLIHALQLKIGAMPFEKRTNIVLTEGITDYYLFTLVKTFTELFDGVDFTIIPGAGASHLKELISLSIAWSDKYVLLLDSDRAGRDAFTKYKRHFGEEQSEYWIKYKIGQKERDVKLENLLDVSDQEKLKKMFQTSDVKRAIPLLFFADETDKKDFCKKLSKDTIANIQQLSNEIKAILKS